MGTLTLRAALPLCFHLFASFCHQVAGGGGVCCAAAGPRPQESAADLERVGRSYGRHHEDNPNASTAAFSIAARGAGSPVKISNCRAACSINISSPGMISRPCSSGTLQQQRAGRVVHHVKHDIGRYLAVEKAAFLMRMHAERRRMHHRVEVARSDLLARQSTRPRSPSQVPLLFRKLRPVIVTFAPASTARTQPPARLPPCRPPTHWLSPI